MAFYTTVCKGHLYNVHLLQQGQICNILISNMKTCQVGFTSRWLYFSRKNFKRTTIFGLNYFVNSSIICRIIFNEINEELNGPQNIRTCLQSLLLIFSKKSEREKTPPGARSGPPICSWPQLLFFCVT